MRDRFILIGIIVVAILVAGVLYVYGGPRFRKAPVLDTTSRVAANTVQFTRLVEGKSSAVTRRVNYLIASPAELVELWKLVNATGTPPTIDFSVNTVVAVFAGKESSSTISVAKIEDDQARTVSILLAKPDGVCVKKPSPAPYEIVVMPATALPLTHQDIVSTTTCP